MSKTAQRVSAFAIGLVLTFGLQYSTADAAEDWNERMNWWDWQSDGDGLEVCPTDVDMPCLVFRKIFQVGRCPNISGDFENIAAGMEAEMDQRLTVKFFSCTASRPEIGVMCVDTGQDGGFEACGQVRMSEFGSFAAADRENFELKSRPEGKDQ